MIATCFFIFICLLFFYRLNIVLLIVSNWSRYVFDSNLVILKNYKGKMIDSLEYEFAVKNFVSFNRLLFDPRFWEKIKIEQFSEYIQYKKTLKDYLDGVSIKHY